MSKVVNVTFGAMALCTALAGCKHGGNQSLAKDIEAPSDASEVLPSPGQANSVLEADPLQDLTDESSGEAQVDEGDTCDVGALELAGGTCRITGGWGGTSAFGTVYFPMSATEASDAVVPSTGGYNYGLKEMHFSPNKIKIELKKSTGNTYRLKLEPPAGKTLQAATGFPLEAETVLRPVDCKTTTASGAWFFNYLFAHRIWIESNGSNRLATEAQIDVMRRASRCFSDGVRYFAVVGPKDKWMRVVAKYKLDNRQDVVGPATWYMSK